VNGWIALALLFVASAAALRLLGLRGPLLQLAAAVLLFGCAGYALQGSPGLAGSPREAKDVEPPIPLTQMRHGFFGDFSPTEHWLVMSEALASQGDTEEAAGVLQSAVREHPGDAQLWVGLGNALVDHAGVLTPASDFAYRRAAELAPGHPAPIFFMGLALARSGDRDGAVTLWKSILADAPADAPWRPMVEEAVAALSNPTPR
jgi:cytochrome c-type biogenesis protein CcmH